MNCGSLWCFTEYHVQGIKPAPYLIINDNVANLYSATLFAHFYALVSLCLFQEYRYVCKFFLKVSVAAGVWRSGSTLFQRVVARYANARWPIALDTFMTQRKHFPAERRDLSGTYGLSKAAIYILEHLDTPGSRTVAFCTARGCLNHNGQRCKRQRNVVKVQTDVVESVIMLK